GEGGFVDGTAGVVSVGNCVILTGVVVGYCDAADAHSLVADTGVFVSESEGPPGEAVRTEELGAARADCTARRADRAVVGLYHIAAGDGERSGVDGSGGASLGNRVVAGHVGAAGIDDGVVAVHLQHAAGRA